MKNYILVFTGTGNSLHLANEISIHIDNVEILPIQAGIAIPTLKPAASIGIIFPVFFMDAPGLVKTYLSQLQIEANIDTYIYSVATCGRYPGNALASIRKILQSKDAGLNFAMPFIMPDSIPFPEFIKMQAKTRQQQESRYKEQFKRLIAAISARKHKKASPMLPPVTLIAHIRSKNVSNFDENFAVTDKCISCGICAKVCGANNITITNEGDYPQFNHNCAACMACFNYCPQDAISYKNHNQEWFQYNNPNLKLSRRLGFYEK
ncbi:EFR1 family ferrodoxin [Culicoidibacter larvae]|nr:EFR1 family ferrodoxin [Culicoidibacter larvae]